MVHSWEWRSRAPVVELVRYGSLDNYLQDQGGLFSPTARLAVAQQVSTVQYRTTAQCSVVECSAGPGGALQPHR